MQTAVKTLANFLATAPIKKLTKGELLLCQDEDVQDVYAIKKGAVRCYDISLDGNQQLISLISEGDLFPLAEPLNIQEKPRFFYSTFMDTEVYVVNRRNLAEFLKSNPATLLELYRTIAHNFADLQYRVNAAAKPKAREKILHTLAFIADRFKNYRQGDRGVEVSLPLTHQDIADLVGLTRETTTTTLKTLRNEGFLNYDKQHFFIHRDRIQDALW